MIKTQPLHILVVRPNSLTHSQLSLAVGLNKAQLHILRGIKWHINDKIPEALWRHMDDICKLKP